MEPTQGPTVTARQCQCTVRTLSTWQPSCQRVPRHQLVVGLPVSTLQSATGNLKLKVPEADRQTGRRLISNTTPPATPWAKASDQTSISTCTLNGSRHHEPKGHGASSHKRILSTDCSRPSPPLCGGRRHASTRRSRSEGKTAQAIRHGLKTDSRPAAAAAES